MPDHSYSHIRNYFVTTLSRAPLTYHTDEVFLETDDVSESDMNFIRNCIYRQELLNLFHLDNFDETILEKQMRELYTLIEYNPAPFAPILQSLQFSYPYFSLDQCFILLFSYDYLFAMHPCLLDYLDTGYIEKEHQTKLLELFEETK